MNTAWAWFILCTILLVSACSTQLPSVDQNINHTTFIEWGYGREFISIAQDGKFYMHEFPPPEQFGFQLTLTRQLSSDDLNWFKEWVNARNQTGFRVSYIRLNESEQFEMNQSIQDLIDRLLALKESFAPKEFVFGKDIILRESVTEAHAGLILSVQQIDHIDSQSYALLMIGPDCLPCSGDSCTCDRPRKLVLNSFSLDPIVFYLGGAKYELMPRNITQDVVLFGLKKWT